MDTIKKYKMFDGKRYELDTAYMTRFMANALKNKLKKQGWKVRIYERGGTMHFVERYHVYKRR